MDSPLSDYLSEHHAFCRLLHDFWGYTPSYLSFLIESGSMFPHPVQIENGFRPQSQPQNGHFLVDCSDPMLTGTIGYLVVYNPNRGVAESEISRRCPSWS